MPKLKNDPRSKFSGSYNTSKYLCDLAKLPGIMGCSGNTLQQHLSDSCRCPLSIVQSLYGQLLLHSELHCILCRLWTKEMHQGAPVSFITSTELYSATR